MTAAGDLREEVGFMARTVEDDGYGNPVSGPWTTQFTCPARIQILRGSETVVAARLAGQRVVAITIRNQPAALAVGTGWRCYDVRAGMVDAETPKRVFDIKVIEPDKRGAWVNILAEEGTLG